MSQLVVTGLTAGYGSTTIVRDADFRLDEGEMLAIVGRNGMGKTTLLKAVLGYLRGSRGSVQMKGEEVLGQPTFKLIRKGVGFAPQEDAVFAELSVRDNLESGGLARRYRKERLAELIDCFPILGERMTQLAGTLSGGEQKMLVLSKALLSDPSLLVIDEISDGMQPRVVTMVRDVLQRERDERGTTILMVEQNLDLSLALADRIAVMKVGNLEFDCPATEENRDRLFDELTL
jgi:ABC-type branched-subunit amino acid transport system ATPase component